MVLAAFTAPVIKLPVLSGLYKVPILFIAGKTSRMVVTCFSGDSVILMPLIFFSPKVIA